MRNKLNFNWIEMRNFMCIGNGTQKIDFHDDSLVYVIGQNLDTSDINETSRNGVGKTSIVNAISFALFGSSISNIRPNNLINTTNESDMLVVLNFNIGKEVYEIHRGRKPNVFKLFIGDEEYIENMAEGSVRSSQEEIEKAIGMSLQMFSQIVAMNNQTIPFPSMAGGKQRNFVEELFGITELTEKADALREKILQVKEQIIREKARVESIENANKHIQVTLESLVYKSEQFNITQKNEINDLKETLIALEDLDINEELKNHELSQKKKELYASLSSAQREQTRLSSMIEKSANLIITLQNKVIKVEHDKTCPTCSQSLSANIAEEVLEGYKAEIKENEKYALETSKHFEKITNEVEELQREIGNIPDVTTLYASINEAHEHKNTIEIIKSTLESKEKEENPFLSQIEDISESAIQTVDYSILKQLEKTQAHQSYLLKLLTDKNSFIRKKIIDRNIHSLNTRIEEYLEFLGLPHAVKFKSDLSFEISKRGHDYDFDSLSRGERTRVTIALQFAFRDVWELSGSTCNLFIIDEVENYLDNKGEIVLQHLLLQKSYSNKSVYFISNRDSIIERAKKALLITKENDFSSFSEVEDFSEI